jgi:hypothetical protein
MIVKKKVSKKAAIKASSRRMGCRVIRANDDIVDDIDKEVVVDKDVTNINIADEATDLLFEAEDVAELLAEVSGEDVAVTADEDAVTFEVGDDVYTVEAEGDEEILESTRVNRAGRKPVRASRRVTHRR